MAPVILRMDVHCHGCAGKIRRAIKNLVGVEEVWVSVDTGLVVVAGTSLDASQLRWRIQTRTRRPVTVVSDGEDPSPPQYAAPPPGYPQYNYYSGGMTHMGQPAPPVNAAYPAYPYGWVPAPAPQHLLQYAPTSDGYFPSSRQYMPFNDDDHPNGCCSVQ